MVRVKDKPKPLDTTLRKGIDELKSMQIVVKQADKNLGLVPIRGDFYAAMLRKWLSPPSFKLEMSFPHADILRRMQNIIRYSKSISQQVKESWITQAKSATNPCPFYAIPKIHKKTKLASRPITAQHSYMLAPLSQALTTVLLNVQSKYVGITKDTVSFVKRMEEFKTPQEFVMMTYDVEACYPSIDINDAIKTLHDNIPVMRENNAFWTKILQLIMYNNYVTANGNIYRQMIGTATGTQVAPPFANLYLYFKFQHILLDSSILLHERFIDDGFVLVSNQEEATRIINQLINCTNLNLTYEISDWKAIFLDLVIYKGRRFQSERRLDLRTYFKPTNRLLYLPMASNHPTSMKAGIITGEAIRTLRNSTDKSEWLKSLHFIFKGLRARGYPPTIIQKAWKNVRWEDREFYITSRTSKTAPEGTLVFTRYNPSTRAHWSNIVAKFPFENIFPKRTYKWNKKQISIMKNWPPKIVWCDFRKVGQQVIAAKQCWFYPKLKRNRTNDPGPQDTRKRLRTS